jgi:hypothetical protein
MDASATVPPETAMHQQTRTFPQQPVLRALDRKSPPSRATRFHPLTPTQAPCAPLIAYHGLGLPEREGVGER